MTSTALLAAAFAAVLSAPPSTPAAEVRDVVDEDAWHPGSTGAAIGGLSGAVGGLSLMGGYLLASGSGQRIELPLGGWELFAAVPISTAAGAALGAFAETAMDGDADFAEVAIAGGGGAVAGIGGGLAALGVGVGTMYLTGGALLARPEANTFENAGFAIIAGGVVGTAAYLATAAVVPALAVDALGE
jgi:hypothetical protein